MAVAKTKDAPKTEEAPDTVYLKCEDLGIDSQAFTPAHAKALLAYQATKGYTHWQPVEAGLAKTDA